MAVHEVDSGDSTGSGIVLSDVTFGYDSTHPVLRSLSARLEEGSFTVIMGPSGCGKTTVLRLMGGLLSPENGSVVGTNTDVGFIFQDGGLLPWLTAEANASLHQLLRGKTARDSSHLGAEMLRRLDGAPCIGKYPHQLSGGMKKRVELARLLLSESRVWLLDEPFESLDLASRLALIGLLSKQWRAARTTAVMVCHSLEDAYRAATHLIVLNHHGNIAYEVDVGDVVDSETRRARWPEIRRNVLRVLERQEPEGRS